MQNSKQFIYNEINGSIHEYTANQLIQGTSPGFLFPWNRFVLAKIFIWISSDPEKIFLTAELTWYHLLPCSYYFDASSLE